MEVLWPAQEAASAKTLLSLRVHSSADDLFRTLWTAPELQVPGRPGTWHGRGQQAPRKALPMAHPPPAMPGPPPCLHPCTLLLPMQAQLHRVRNDSSYRDTAWVASRDLLPQEQYTWEQPQQPAAGQNIVACNRWRKVLRRWGRLQRGGI